MAEPVKTEIGRGQRNALGVLNILMVAALIVVLFGVGAIAGVPAIPLGTVSGLIVAAVMIFGKLPH